MPFLAPLIAAVSSAIGAVGAFVAGLGIIGQAAIVIGLQLAVSALKKKPQKQQAEKAATGTQLEVQYGATVARQIGVGRFASAGHDIYTNSYGPANKYLQKVFVLSDFFMTALTRVAINGTWANINFSVVDGDKGWTISGYEEQAWIKFYDGRQTTADPGLVANSNPAGRWTEQHVGKGVAYVVVTLAYTDGKMNSIPSFLFECQGAPCYDIRLDSTAGGSGNHRWNDVSTWEYTENPITHVYNYERGFFHGAELIIGKGMPSSDLPASPWISAANICSESLEGAQRYRSGSLITAAAGISHRDNIEPILRSAAAALVERVDGDQPIVGANQPVVAVLTDDDLIVDASHSYQAKRTRSNLINAVFGSYNYPEDLWSATAYPPRIDEIARQVDRERHAVQIDFSTVFDLGQAIRLSDIAVRENRYQASAAITVRPRWIGLEPGDWIRWNSKRRGNRVYRVTSRQLAAFGPSGTRNVQLTLDEVGDGIYNSAVVIPEVTPRIPLTGPEYALTVNNFIIVATASEAPSGRKLPALLAQWDFFEDLTVREVLVQYWQDSEPLNRLEARFQMPVTQGLIIEGVLPVTLYRARACVVCDPPRAVVWSREWTVTTVGEDIVFDTIQLQEDVRNILQGGTDAMKEFNELLESLAASTYLNNAQALLDQQMTSARLIDESEVRKTQTSVLAKRTTGVEVRLNNTVSAFGTAIQTLSAQATEIDGRVTVQAAALTAAIAKIDGDIAQAISSLEATVDEVDGRVTAQAQAILGVQASLTDVTASGLISFKVVAQDGNSSSRIAIMTKAAVGDTFKESGIYIDTTQTTSQILIRSDKFIVSNGSLQTQPFTAEDGYIKFTTARFQQLISVNSKLQIDGTTGFIYMYD